MFSEEVTTEVPQLQLPPDLLAEVSRRNAPRTGLHVDGLETLPAGAARAHVGPRLS